jgi:hypothetical protein
VGSNWTPEVEYRCSNDCDQSGCPSHKMKLEYHRGSDVVTLWVDGKPEHYFDDNGIAALKTLLGMKAI